MLGTTNKGHPFLPDESGTVPAPGAQAVWDLKLDGLISLVVMAANHRAQIDDGYNVPIVGVPKTIDNDLHNTDYTFGFWSVDVATVR